MSDTDLVVSKEEFLNWRENKITKYLYAELELTREQYKDYLATGETLADDSTARWVGRIEGVNQVFHIMGITQDEVKQDGQG